MRQVGNANMCVVVDGPAHLVKDNVEAAKEQNGPDEDIAKDASDKVGRMVDHEGTVPEERDKCPRQRRRDNRRVDEARVRVVPGVE